jgi:hypothetical protein
VSRAWDYLKESERGAFLTLFYFAVSQSHSGTRGMSIIDLAAIVLEDSRVHHIPALNAISHEMNSALH